MSDATKKPGPIAVYGATGYTGKLIAAELAGSGLDFVLAGRSRMKLEALAEDLAIDVDLTTSLTRRKRNHEPGASQR